MIERSKEVVLEPGGNSRRYWLDLWDFRNLLFFLSWRDLAVRYRQTIFGALWALIQPLTTMVAFTLIFGKIAQLPSDGVPYHLFVYAASLPWLFFATCLSSVSNSMITNAALMRKVYFPRLLAPLSAIAVAIVDFFISFTLLITLVLAAGLPITWRILFVPFLLVLTGFSALSLGMWFSALNVRYRDFRFLLPFALQLGIYLTPVGFTTTSIPEHWRSIMALNPMYAIVEGFRWSLFGIAPTLDFQHYLINVILIGLIFAGGFIYFRREEARFTDLM
jgi:lipopolysaccharide transport system permease protein